VKNIQLISTFDFLKKYRVILLSSVTIFVFLLVVYWYVSDTNFNVPPAIHAVPANAAFIIETGYFDEIIHNLENQSDFWNLMLTFKSNRYINRQFAFIDSILKKNNSANKLISGRPVVISGHLSGKDRLDLLYALSLTHVSDENSIKKIISSLVSGKANIDERTYDKITLFYVKFADKSKNNTKDFAYCFYNGVFVISSSAILVENSIRQFNAKSLITDNPNLKEIVTKSSKKVPANVYINFAYFPKLIATLFNSNFRKTIQALSFFANWSAFTLDAAENSISLKGNTYTTDSSANYLNIFVKQSPQKHTIFEILPDKTTCFLHFGVQNFDVFMNDYKFFLRKIDELSRHDQEIAKIKEETKIDIQKLFLSHLKSEMALAYVDESRQGKLYDIYFVGKLKSSDEFEEKLSEMTKNYCKKNNQNPKPFSFIYAVGDKKYPVYQMPFDFVIQKIFGNLFSSCAASYYTFIDDFVIFGTTRQSIFDYIDNYRNNRLLGKQKEFTENIANIPASSSLLFYCNAWQSSGLFEERLAEETSKTFTSNLNSLKQLKPLIILFSGEKKSIETQISMASNPKSGSQVQISWETKLDTTVAIKPVIVKNHMTGVKEVLVQDLDNKLYLISAGGSIIWKIKLSERIKSDIFQIDLFKNGKLQYAFSTENKIFVIDRNGDNVEKFPIKLKSPATNGLAVFDYEKNLDYRFFIASKDLRVNAFDKNGKAIDSWQFEKSQDKIQMPLQCFQVEGKDYIVFADDINIYIVNRKGETRVKLTTTFPKSQRNKFYYEAKTEKSRARLVTTNTSGEVHFIYFDGSIKKMVLSNFSASHYFEYLDINSDGLKEFIFFDNNTLDGYDREKNKIFSYSMPGDVNFEPKTFVVNKNEIKIGIVSYEAGQMYLFNRDGSISKGFPVNGSSPFCLGSLNKNAKFNLILGNKDNYLYNYQIN